MRFFNLIALLATSASLVAAQEEVIPEGTAGEFLDTDSQAPFQVQLDYTIQNKPSEGVIELTNGEEIAVNYTMSNFEDVEVSVVGVGGRFIDPTTGEHLANITDSRIGPITLQPGESQAFSQRIAINLLPMNYIMSPSVYVVKGQLLTLIGARNQLAIVSDEKISFFNPQLIFVELVLLATLGAVGYFIYITYGIPYLNVAGKTNNSKPKRSTRSAAAPAPATGVVDQSWLPETHLKKVNKKSNK